MLSGIIGISGWVIDEGWVGACSFQTDPGSQKYFEPPETCGADVEPGSEYCPLHEDADQEPPDSEHAYGSFKECYDFHTEMPPHD